MRCQHCSHDLPAEARFCPGCGRPAPAPAEAKPQDISITAEGVRPGVWNWTLLALLAGERLIAWKAFPLADAAPWERVFLYGWGWGLAALAGPALGLRWRAGGWLAFLSGFALIARSCVPLLGEDPASWAVVTLMVASATLSFAFLYEQSFWPHLPSPLGGNSDDPDDPRPGQA
ncbi:MAG TPA: zinc ribbon domain-containing protein [Holophagaceae bacterium]|nr:zinc ribbon domain-containing protein [Holophagaceae bacterium]